MSLIRGGRRKLMPLKEAVYVLQESYNSCTIDSKSSGDKQSLFVLVWHLPFY